MTSRPTNFQFSSQMHFSWRRPQIPGVSNSAESINSCLIYVVHEAEDGSPKEKQQCCSCKDIFNNRVPPWIMDVLFPEPFARVPICQGCAVIPKQHVLPRPCCCGRYLICSVLCTLHHLWYFLTKPLGEQSKAEIGIKAFFEWEWSANLKIDLANLQIR